MADGNGGHAFIIFWSYIDYFKEIYPLGVLISVSGVLEIDGYNKIVFNHPVIKKLDVVDELSFKKVAILPVYPVTDKMRKSNIST